MFKLRKSPAPNAGFGLLFLNTRVTIHCSAIDSSAPISVQEHWLPFGESAPLHRHFNEDEIFHILDGAVRFRVGDEEKVGRRGDTLVAPKGVPHTFRVESPDGARFLVMAPGPDFEGLVREMARPALSDVLPPSTAPTPEEQEILADAALRHGIEILGPPMGAA